MYKKLSKEQKREIFNNSENLSIRDFVKKFEISRISVSPFYNVVKLNKPDVSFINLLFYLGFTDYEIRDFFAIGKTNLKLKDVRYYRKQGKFTGNGKGVLVLVEDRFFVFSRYIEQCRIHVSCLPDDFDISAFGSNLGGGLPFDVSWSLVEASYYFSVFKGNLRKFLNVPSVVSSKKIGESEANNENSQKTVKNIDSDVANKVVEQVKENILKIKPVILDTEKRNIAIEGSKVMMTEKEFNKFRVNRSLALISDNFDWVGKSYLDYKPRNSFFCIEFCKVVELLEDEFWENVYHINIGELTTKGVSLMKERINSLEADPPVKKYLNFMGKKILGDIGTIFKKNKEGRLYGQKIVHELSGKVEYLDVDYDWLGNFLNKKFEKI